MAVPIRSTFIFRSGGHPETAASPPTVEAGIRPGRTPSGGAADLADLAHVASVADLTHMADVAGVGRTVGAAGEGYRRASARPRRALVCAAGGLAALAGTAVLAMPAAAGSGGREVRVVTRVLPTSVTRIDLSAGPNDAAIYGHGATPPPGVVFPASAARSHPPAIVLVARLSGVAHHLPVLDVTTVGTTTRISSHCTPPTYPLCATDYYLSVPAGRRVTVSTSGGSVTATGFDGSLHLRSSAGDLTVTSARGDVDATTTAGDVRIFDARARSVRASTNSGDVRVDAAVAPDSVDAHSSAGDVQVLLPSGAPPYAADVSTQEGDRQVSIRSDPGASRHLRATTSSGDVTVGYRATP
ncbi:hypothetical protein FAIPA1_680006 [Frankia sp. AiPs1]|uniref:DUF4097 family beta strand repeat-containing protein n=1 Tax=Frankia sp. AiPa1 TaxID=573492 RepID=UPI00202B90A7|nr:DUF4097 family beta strand repeat-containing protein [Frankia sp. AiPa1]MCL9758969.1 DUF4097 domain-containing protein [Frankia sp. AiPa1]